jgi:hypothetical protein
MNGNAETKQGPPSQARPDRPHSDDFRRHADGYARRPSLGSFCGFAGRSGPQTLL